MVIAIVSHGFDASGIAYLLKNEGNVIHIWVEKKIRALENVAGIKVFHSDEISLEEFIEKNKKAGLILFDGSEYSAIQDRLRKEGLNVVGSSKLGEAVERSRIIGCEVAKRCGINIPNYFVFNSLNELKKFLRESKGKYVLKQSGNLPKNFNFSGDSEEIIEHIEGFEKRNKKSLQSGKIKIENFMLQEFIEGYEVAVAGFFTPQGWLRTEKGRILLEINFEHKKLAPFDIGPTTGEMGTVAYFDSGRNIIFEQMLEPLEKLLASYSNWGVVDANCIVNEEGIYLLEHTIRFGYPISDLYSILLDKQLGISYTEFLNCIATGTKVPEIKMEGFGIVYVVAYPIFPYENVKAKEESFLFEYVRPPEKDGYVFCPGLLSRDAGKWYISDVFGYAYTISVFDEDLEDAMKKGKELLNEIHPKSSAFYRPDIGERVREIPKYVWDVLHTLKVS